VLVHRGTLQGVDPTPLDGVQAPLLAIRAVPGSAAALIPWYHELDPGDRERADRAFPDLQRVFADGWAPFLVRGVLSEARQLPAARDQPPQGWAP
jgi:hypothetical protein